MTGDFVSGTNRVKDTVDSGKTLIDSVSRLLNPPKPSAPRRAVHSQRTETGDRMQTNVNCRFYVQVDGLEQAVFSEMSGLQIETETLDLIEGGANDRVRRLPVRSRVGNITLKRGVTTGDELLQWYLKIVQGTADYRNVTVTAYRTDGSKLVTYSFQNAYPVKWSGPQFAANGEAVAVESLELTHDGTLNLNQNK